MKKDRFFVLPYSLHGDHIPSFIGRIVLDPLDPNRRFVPLDHEDAGPETIAPGITGNPIPYKSQADIILSKNAIALRGDEVKRYQMIQNKVQFGRLMENPKFEKETRALMAKSFRGHVYLVGGFLTTKGTKWDVEVSRSRMVAARAQAPTGTASGAGPDLDIGAEAAISHSEQQKMTGDVEQEKIFAVAYDIVQPKRSVPWKSSRYMAERPVLGDEKRASGSHLYLGGKGGNSSDEEMEEPGKVSRKSEFRHSKDEAEDEDRKSEFLEIEF